MKQDRTVFSYHFNKKPVWFTFLNKIWKGSYRLGTKVNLEKDHLIKLARKQTGLHSFGNDFYEEPLERLLRSINEEADLHPVGRFITQKRMVNLLATRLRVEKWLKLYPEILEQKLYPVRLICGLQRTGTTKLHRLLASDPDNRTLLSWEAINPVPLNSSRNEKAKRLRIARISEKSLRFMAPGFFSIHPVIYEAPEEDILLLDTSFMSTTPEATMHVPSYASWLEETDQSAAYEYMVKLLKLLQWQNPAKFWVLKSPHHMEFLPLVKKYFVKVHYIWTHRSLYESLPSFMSMMAHSQTIFSSSVSLEKVAEHWIRKTAYMLSKGIEFRKKNPGEKFTDVFYVELTKDILKVLSEIYQGQDSFTPALQKVFLETDRNNPPNRYGYHFYDLKDFGISKSRVDKEISDYVSFMREQEAIYSRKRNG